MYLVVSSLKVVVEVRKAAEKDATALMEALEAMRRAVIAEGCYPSRLVRVRKQAGGRRVGLRGSAYLVRTASLPSLVRKEFGFPQVSYVVW